MTTTYTGRLLMPSNFGVPSPLDIAVQLGRMPRFAGATRVWPWSVLHHTCACYRYAVTMDFMPQLLGMVLLHDAEECATGDIPTTWKTNEIRELQSRLSDHILYVYTGGASENMLITPAAIRALREIDMLMLAAEMNVVGPPGVQEHSGFAYNYLRSVVPSNLRKAEEIVSKVSFEFGALSDSQKPDGELVKWFLEALREFCQHFETGDLFEGLT